jgi:hypothetical protein
MTHRIDYDDDGQPIRVFTSHRPGGVIPAEVIRASFDIIVRANPSTLIGSLPPGWCTAADEQERARVQQQRVTTRRGGEDAITGISLDDADAAVVRAYRRSYASEADDGLARDAAESADPLRRSRDRTNAVLRAAGIRARRPRS